MLLSHHHAIDDEEISVIDVSYCCLFTSLLVGFLVVSVACFLAEEALDRIGTY